MDLQVSWIFGFHEVISRIIKLLKNYLVPWNYRINRSIRFLVVENLELKIFEFCSFLNSRTLEFGSQRVV